MKDQFSFEDTDESIRQQNVWALVLKRLQPDVPPAWFERFIRPLRPVSFSNGKFVVSVPGRFVMEWVRDRYFTTIQSYLTDELGKPVELELKTEARSKQSAADSAAVTVSTTAGDHKRFVPNERYTFDNFVVGQSNRLAFAGAKAVAQDPGKRFNPLFIYGASGLGKTHLMHAIAIEVLANDPKYDVYYLTAQQFAEDFINALHSQRSEQFRRVQRSAGMWLVDDIQFIAGKERTSEEIFYTFNHLHSLGKQIVFCSDRPPRDLHLMEERLRSRFEWGLVADIQMPDTETRSAILLSKARMERIVLSADVAMYLAETVPGNIRVLEGALTKLAVQSSVEGKPLSLEMAQSMVETYYRSGGYSKPGFDQIVEAVSKHFRIPEDDIRGTSRKAPIVHARHVAVFVTREITGDSWKHIGTLFGDRDHSSMMHGYQKINELMHQDRDLKATVKMLIRNLYPEA
jgi:chromosomal replication initiator protein